MTRLHRFVVLGVAASLWCCGGKGGGSSSGSGTTGTASSSSSSSTTGSTTGTTGIVAGGACSPAGTAQCTDGRTQAYCTQSGWELRNCSGPSGCAGTTCDRHDVQSGSACDSLDTAPACDLGGVNQLQCNQATGTWGTFCFCGAQGCDSQTGQCVAGCASTSTSTSGSTSGSTGTTSSTGSSGTSGGSSGSSGSTGGQCSTAADCPYDNPGCLNNFCGYCGANSDCPSGMFCGVDSSCHCTGNSSCGGDAPLCENLQPDGGGSNGVCGCRSSNDCSNSEICDKLNFLYGACAPSCINDPSLCQAGSSTPFCETAGPYTGLCVPCRTNNDCPTTDPYCTSLGCAQCRYDTDCQALDAGTPFCAGTCVACRSAADCTGGAVGCDSATNTCGSCSANADCPTGMGCGSGTCEPYCTSTAPTNCVLCASDVDCGGAVGSCDQGYCGGIPDGGIPDAGGFNCGSYNCTNGLVCDTGTMTCVDCLSNPDCAGKGSSTLCDTNSKTCVECLSATDCPYSRPGCFGGYCGGCSSFLDCPSGQACTNSYCSCSNSTQCGGDAPACVAVGDAGSVCGCTGAGDCGGGLCDLVNYLPGACVTNCTVDGGACNQNGANPYCDATSTDANYGLCLACLSDTQCQQNNAGNHCTSQGCVQCTVATQGTDCGGSTPYCSSSGSCAECRTSADCATPSAGCNSVSGNCGSCAVDSDCPSNSCNFGTCN